MSNMLIFISDAEQRIKRKCQLCISSVHKTTVIYKLTKGTWGRSYKIVKIFFGTIHSLSPCDVQNYSYYLLRQSASVCYLVIIIIMNHKH